MSGKDNIRIPANLKMLNSKEVRKQFRAQQKETLGDSYIERIIRRNTKLENEDIPKDLIAIKRAQIQIQGLVNRLDKGIVKTCDKHGHLTIDDCNKSGCDGGYQRYKCRACQKESHAANYLKNKDNIASRINLYKKENPDKIRKWKRESWHRNKDKNATAYRLKKREWALKNRDLINARGRVYRKLEVLELHDSYIKEQLVRSLNVSAANVPEFLIEPKRRSLILKRAIKEHLEKAEHLDGEWLQASQDELDQLKIELKKHVKPKAGRE